MPVKGSSTPSHIRVARHYTPDVNTGCWNWTGSLSTQGSYPTFTDSNGQIVYAYRWMFEQTFGPIPEGHHVHHECLNRQCINPAHLKALSPAEHAAAHRAEREARYISRLPWCNGLVRSGWTNSRIKATLGLPAYVVDAVRKAIINTDQLPVAT